MRIRITKGKTLSRQALDRVMRKQLPPLGVRQRILDIGGKHSPYGHLLKSKLYVTLDIVERLRPGVLCDAHAMPIRSRSVDTVLASQTLEHCRVPQLVIDETHRVLADHGVAIFSVPFAYVIHADPSDYWRFTRYALAELFQRFSQTEIYPVGNHFAAVWDLATRNYSLVRYLNYLMFPLAFSRESSCPCGYLVIATK